MKKIKFKIKNEKYNNVVNTIIVFLFCFAILFFIIKLITGLFDKKGKYDIQNINQYIYTESNDIKENITVSDYSTFYTIQGILEQYVNALMSSKYDSTYDLLDKEMKNIYDKKSYVSKIKEFAEENFIIQDPDKLYFNKDELRNLFKLSDTDYIGEYKTINGDVKKIGVRLDQKASEYKIFYIEM